MDTGSFKIHCLLDGTVKEAIADLLASTGAKQSNTTKLTKYTKEFSYVERLFVL